MKNILACFLFLSIITSVHAQKHGEKDFRQSREKIEAAKIGFLTSKLDLTREQAIAFWPVYNEYSDKRFAIKESMLKNKMRRPSDDDKEVDWEKRLEELSNMRKKEFELEDEYKAKFLKIISAKQVISLFKAEREFMDMLRSRISEKRGGSRDGFRPRDDRH